MSQFWVSVSFEFGSVLSVGNFWVWVSFESVLSLGQFWVGFGLSQFWFGSVLGLVQLWVGVSFGLRTGIHGLKPLSHQAVRGSLIGTMAYLELTAFVFKTVRPWMFCININ